MIGFQNSTSCKIWPETSPECEKWWLKCKIFSADAAKLGGPPGPYTSKMTRRAYSTMLCRVIRRQWRASFGFSGNRQICGNPVLVFEVWQLLCIQLTPYWNSWRFRHINEHMQKESLRTSIFDQNNWRSKPNLRTQKLQKN